MVKGLTIRPAVESDVPAAFAMIEELAVFEKSAHLIKTSAEELREACFGEHRVCELTMAEVNGSPVGIAICYVAYSTWKGPYLYLEDFIVKEGYRSVGIGSALFTYLMELCKARKYRMMGWQVLDWNEGAIRFYKKFGAELQTEWLNGRIYFEE
ncbi:MAG: GNAT family N-acetyltransferase [Salibacteraceae bacterium]